MPKVSILIPVYNVEKYLRQCLGSVVNQTLQDIEIICINDGSTDSSPEIIREFADKDPRIKVINKQNTGYGHSMNQGLRAATGEYIGIVESDDFVELNMFETLYDKAVSVDAEVLKSHFFGQIRGNAVTRKFNDSLPYEKIFSFRKKYLNVFLPMNALWSAIYKHDLLSKNKIEFNETPGASYQDVAFMFKVWACADRVFLIKEPFYHYRMDNPNASMKSKQKVYCIFDEFEEVERFLASRSDLRFPYQYIIEVMKFKICLTTYGRIDDSFKFDFLERMYEELKKDDETAYIKSDYWPEDEWAEVQTLLHNKTEFFYNQYEKSQRIYLYKHGIYTVINSFDKIYVYGAGFVALQVMNGLFSKQVSITGVIVTNAKKDSNMFMDTPVSDLDNSNVDKVKDLILIAVKQSDQHEILYKLQKLGYKNILIVTPDLRRML